MSKSFSFAPLCRDSAGVLCPALVNIFGEPHQRENREGRKKDKKSKKKTTEKTNGSYLN